MSPTPSKKLNKVVGTLEVFILLLPIFAGASSLTPVGYAKAMSYVNQDILVDTVWDKSGSPYIIQKSIMVAEGATLKIEPGVEVDVIEKSTITVYGKIVAGSVGGEAVNVKGWGKPGTFSVQVKGGNLHIENAVIENVLMTLEDADVKLSRLKTGSFTIDVFNRSMLAAAGLEAESLKVGGGKCGIAYSILSIENSEVKSIEVSGYAGVYCSTVRLSDVQSQTMKVAGKPPYWVGGVMGVDVYNSTVYFNMVYAGKVDMSGYGGFRHSFIKFDGGRVGDIIMPLDVYNSTVEVYSVEADTVNFCPGTMVRSKTFFENVVANKIMFNGSKYWGEIASNSNITFNRIVCRTLAVSGMSGDSGIDVRNSTIKIVGSTVAYGSGVYVRCLTNSVLEISGSNVYGNSPYGLYVGSSSGMIIGKNPVVKVDGNWWGDASGPTNPKLNPGGKGDTIIVPDNTTISKWLTSPAGGAVMPRSRLEPANPVIARGSPASFMVAAEGSRIAACFMDFGDGSVSGWTRDLPVVHVYNAVGEYLVTAYTVHENMLLTKASALVRVASPPSVKIVSPANGTLLKDNMVKVDVNVEDPVGIILCQIKVDDFTRTVKPNTTRYAGTVSLGPIADGWHLVEVNATNVFGLSSLDNVVVGTDTITPCIEIEAPPATSGTFTLKWNITDNFSGVNPDSVRISCGRIYFPRAVVGSINLTIDATTNIIVYAADYAGNTIEANFTIKYVGKTSTATATASQTETSSSTEPCSSESSTIPSYHGQEGEYDWINYVVPFVILAAVVAAVALAVVYRFRRKREVAEIKAIEGETVEGGQAGAGGAGGGGNEAV
ncbi:MAG: hypothetical protein QXZ08_00670 [Nitrososphaeria archaeon]